MYVRLTNYQVDPAHLDDLNARLDGIKLKLKQLPGVIDIYTAWRNNGEGVTMAVYASQADAEAATPHVKDIWSELSNLLTSPPSMHIYENVEHLTA